MTHLAACGYPVPRVYEITDTDMVLERLTGPTMLDVLARRPWRVGSLGRVLGRLHDRLHTLPAPEWLPKRFSTADGDRVLHLDLHPGNVILTRRGPVVIDWCNAGAGDPAADVAMTMVTVGSADVPGLAARLGRGLLLRAMRSGCRTDPAGRMQEAVRVKLEDPNLTPRRRRGCGGTLAATKGLVWAGRIGQAADLWRSGCGYARSTMTRADGCCGSSAGAPGRW